MSMAEYFMIVPQASREHRDADQKVDGGRRRVARAPEELQVEHGGGRFELVHHERDEGDSGHHHDRHDKTALEPSFAVSLLEDVLQRGQPHA
jgi:hypothetical protein